MILYRNNKKKGRNSKKLLAVCLVLTMLAGILSGCGKGEAPQSGEQGMAANDGTDTQGSAGQSDVAMQSNDEEAEDGTAAMGRYVETAVDISEQVGNAHGITLLADGRLLIPEEKTGMLISADGGETWEAKPIPGIDSMAAFIKDNYIFDMAAAPDGTVAVLYVKNGEYDKTGTFTPLLHVGKADGTVQTLDSLPLQAEDVFVKKIF